MVKATYGDFNNLGQREVGRYMFDFFIINGTDIILSVQDTVLHDLVLDPDELECEFIMMTLRD